MSKEHFRLMHVVLIEDDKDTRSEITKQCSTLLGDAVCVHELQDVTLANSIKTVKDLLDSHEAVIIALDLIHPGEEESGALHYLKALVDACPGVRTVAYSRRYDRNRVSEVYQHGAVRFVTYEQIGTLIHAIALENQFKELENDANLWTLVLNSLNAGVSVQDAEGQVMYTNTHNANFVGKPRAQILGKKCWEVYHNFRHRSSHCTICIANRLMCQNVTARPDCKDSGAMILPIKGQLKKISVFASIIPSITGSSASSVVSETSLDDPLWKDKPVAERVQEMLDDLRSLTNESPVSLPCPFVALFLGVTDSESAQPNPANTQLYLYRLAKSPGLGPQHALQACVRAGTFQLPTKSTLPDGAKAGWVRNWPGTNNPAFLIWKLLPEKTERGLNWVAALAYVCVEEKEDDLFLEDFFPYWAYARDCAPQAIDDRKQQLAAAIKSATWDLMAQFVAHDYRTTDDSAVDRILALAAQVLKNHFTPISLHVRKLSPSRKELVKLTDVGYGPYFERTPLSISVSDTTHGSVRALAQRRPDLAPAVARNTGDALTQIIETPGTDPAVARDLKSIAGYINIPIENQGLMWGCLCLQFADDFLQSDNNVRDLTTFGRGLQTLLELPTRTALRLKALKLTRRFEETLVQPVSDRNHRLHEVLRIALLLTNSDAVALCKGFPVSKLQSKASRDAAWPLPKQFHFLQRPSGFGLLKETIDATSPLLQPFEALYCLPVPETDLYILAFAQHASWLNAHDQELLESIAAKVGMVHVGMEARRELKVRATGWHLELLLARYLARCSTLEDVGGILGLAILNAAPRHMKRVLVVIRSGIKTFALELEFQRTSKLAKRLFSLQLPGIVPMPYTPAWLLLFKARNPSTAAFAADVVHHVKLTMHLKDFQEPVPDTPESNRVLYSVPYASPETTLALFLEASPDQDLSDESRRQANVMLEMAALRFESLLRGSLEQELARMVAYSLRTKATHMENAIREMRKNAKGKLLHQVDALEHNMHLFLKTGDLTARSMGAKSEFLRWSRFDLRDVVHDVTVLLEDARIECILGTSPIPVDGDADRIRDAILEVVSNSVDFVTRFYGTPRRGLIKVQAKSQGQNAVVTVDDDGPGMSPIVKKNLFRMFYSYPGDRVGLGLYYAQQVLIAHEGSVRLLGKRSRGTRMQLQFPLTRLTTQNTNRTKQ